ncbi:hypothetical protein NPIL_563701 [Nephila pilipes]|uniref:Uncharacterized protein n=1 Tax=Nephila pilipes TaxID=299642 RepID=A0A8X6TRU5_NEPPI|nr:hypothetical protein NPIL_563701 [Nephila pilipes]
MTNLCPCIHQVTVHKVIMQGYICFRFLVLFILLSCFIKIRNNHLAERFLTSIPVSRTIPEEASVCAIYNAQQDDLKPQVYLKIFTLWGFNNTKAQNRFSK